MTQQFLFITAILLGIAACNKSKSGEATTPVAMTDEQLVIRGKAVYMSVCIACHNSDPHKDGALGPAIFGSSPELLEARILYAKYPDGYTPKRATGVMPAFVYLKADLPALQKFLNTP